MGLDRAWLDPERLEELRDLFGDWLEGFTSPIALDVSWTGGTAHFLGPCHFFVGPACILRLHAPAIARLYPACAWPAQGCCCCTGRGAACLLSCSAPAAKVCCCELWGEIRCL